MHAKRPGWQSRLADTWWTAQQPAWIWRAFETLYITLVRLRRLGFSRGWLSTVRLAVPVIVVGNRIVGGAGKTPVTLALLHELQRQGWQPGVVSRGHGGHGAGIRTVTASSSPADVGDEPVLIARRSGVPIRVGRDRCAVAQALLADQPHVDIIVCDDGLQHLSLGRDIELIVFDSRGIGNGHCLPAGPLREPIDVPSTAPHRWVLYNAPEPSTDLPGALLTRALAGRVALRLWHEDRAAPALGLAELAATTLPVWAVAGIGAPQRFFDDLRSFGLTPRTVAMEDHATYEQLPWPDAALHVLVTEKDAVKLDPDRVARERPHTQVWVVPMQLTLPPALSQGIFDALGRRPGAS